MGIRFRLDRPLGNGLWVGTWSINGFGYLGKLVGCLAWFMVWLWERETRCLRADVKDMASKWL